MTKPARPSIPESHPRLPDLLDCVLVWTVAEFESGRSTPIDAEEISELCGNWESGFALDAERRYALAQHESGDLEWVGLVTDGLLVLAGVLEEPDWTVELVTHVAYLTGERLPGLETWGRGWAVGVIPEFGGIGGILRSAFPTIPGYQPGRN